jgi:hypothetical protein
MKIESKFDEKLNYDNITDRDKKIVKEVIEYLKTKDISEKTCDAVFQKFQLKEEPVYDLEKSNFLRHIKKLKLYYNDQGFIKEGEYPDVIRYPIVDIQYDIRVFEKIYASILEEGIKIGQNIDNEKSNQ